MFNILITAPSLNENVNISGISTITRTIISNNSAQHRYFHFRVGKKDGDRKNIRWLFNQIALMPRFFLFIIKNKIDFIHFNTDLTRLSILRDFPMVIAGSILVQDRILLHIHGGHYLMNPPPRNTLFFYLINTMLKRAANNIVLSDIEEHEIRKNFQRNSKVMPNAVDVDSITHTSHKDFSGKLQLFFMGRMVRSKGIFLIAEALKGLGEYFDAFDLQLYGSGPDLEEFVRQLSQIEGLNFFYNGIVKGAEKSRVIENSHIFILPSLYGEGLPIAMLESMAFGCVPVVSDDASIGTVVKHDVSGYICIKGSSSALSTNLIRVFKQREKLQELSKNAQQAITESCNLQNYIADLNKLYKPSGK